MRLFKSDWVDWVLTTLKVPDDVPIENKRVTSSIASAQSQVEAQNFESRKNVLKYDDVMSRQREVVYRERRAVLEGADLHEQIREMVDDAVEGYVRGATQGYPEEWNLEALWTALRTLYPIGVRLADVEEDAGGRDGLDADYLVKVLQEDAQAAYGAREAQIGSEVMRELERRVLLSVLDRKWREHLYEMDYLREGIGLRAYSQRDPLVEYQREGFDMFGAMMEAIKEESVAFLFNLEVQVEEPAQGSVEDGVPEELVAPDGGRAAAVGANGAAANGAAASGAGAANGAPGAPVGLGKPQVEEHHPVIRAKGLDAPKTPSELTYTAPSEQGGAEVSQTTVAVEDEFDGIARNAMCPCGSGKKYKKCHGAPGGPTGLTARVS